MTGFDLYSRSYTYGGCSYRYDSNHDEMLPLSHPNRAYCSDHRSNESYTHHEGTNHRPNVASNMRYSTRSFVNPPDIPPDNISQRDEKLPPCNSSEEYSKKRKHEMADNDVSALTDGTNNHILSILPLMLSFFKNSDAKYMKITTGKNGKNICLKITEGTSSTTSSQQINRKLSSVKFEAQ